MKFAVGPVFDQKAAGPLSKESSQYGAATGVVVVVGVVVEVVDVVEVVELVVVAEVDEVVEVVVLAIVVAVAAEITDVGFVVAIVEPFLFVAITATRSVKPTSAATMTYLVLLAFAIGAHSAPELLQRFH